MLEPQKEAESAREVLISRAHSQPTRALLLQPDSQAKSDSISRLHLPSERSVQEQYQLGRTTFFDPPFKNPLTLHIPDYQPVMKALRSEQIFE